MDVCEGQKGKERKPSPFKAKSIIVNFFFFGFSDINNSQEFGTEKTFVESLLFININHETFMKIVLLIFFQVKTEF